MDYSSRVARPRLPVFWPPHSWLEMLASISLLPLLQRSPLPPEPLPLWEWAVSPPELCVFQAALRRPLFSPLAILQASRSLLVTESAALCDTVSEPGPRLVQHPFNYINRSWTKGQKCRYLNSRKRTTVTLSNKNTQGEHFSCSFCMERRKTSCTRKTLNQHLNGVLVTIPFTYLKLRNAFAIIVETFCFCHDGRSLRY